MAKTVSSYLAEAKALVPTLSPEEARRLQAEQNALIVDVRDAPEVAANGKIPGALNVSRGMLEFRADPETPYYDKEFQKERPIILYCASGGRSALAGKVLQDMGYGQVFNLGAAKSWTEAGYELEGQVPVPA